MPYRIVQWTTGNVGKRSVRAIMTNAELELVGCYAWSPDKVGRDVGQLVGIDQIGVEASSDVDALLALEPDCVVYTPMWPDVDEIVRILEAGVNISATAAFITGHALGEGAPPRITAACERGGSSIFGTGINPGFADLLAIVTAGVCDRIDKITVSESVDTTGYDSPETELPVGWGRPLDDPDLPAMTRRGTAVLGDAVAMIGDAIGVEFDEIVCETRYAATTEDVDLGSWRIPAGGVAGVDARWQGRIGDRVVVESQVRWNKGQTLDREWPVSPEVYVVTVEGRPTIRTRLEILPPPDFEATTFADLIALGMVLTAMPAVNTIPQVVAAAPGIITYNDIPLPQARGWVRTSPAGG